MDLTTFGCGLCYLFMGADRIRKVSEPKILDSIMQEELARLQRVYGHFFTQPSRTKAFAYVESLTRPMRRKSVEAMVLEYYGRNRNKVRTMQNFLREGAWSDTDVRAHLRQDVAGSCGDPNGMLFLDEICLPKQGQHSAGVQRQFCERSGRMTNCQTGIFLTYAANEYSVFLDEYLYLPRPWLEDSAYVSRRHACGIPENMPFRTKSHLGGDLIEAAVAGGLPARWVVCSDSLGRDSTLHDRIRACGLGYLVEVAHHTRVRYLGNTSPLRVQDIAGMSSEWPVADVSIRNEHQCTEYRLCPVSSPSEDGGTLQLLLYRQSNTGILKYYLAWTPAATQEADWIGLRDRHRVIASCYRRARQHLGMGRYEGRSWRGWTHHMTLVFLAYWLLECCQYKDRIRP